jgi:hypothetical protein
MWASRSRQRPPVALPGFSSQIVTRFPSSPDSGGQNALGGGGSPGWGRLAARSYSKRPHRAVSRPTLGTPGPTSHHPAPAFAPPWSRSETRFAVFFSPALSWLSLSREFCVLPGRHVGGRCAMRNPPVSSQRFCEVGLGFARLRASRHNRPTFLQCVT